MIIPLIIKNNIAIIIGVIGFFMVSVPFVVIFIHDYHISNSLCKNCEGELKIRADCTGGERGFYNKKDFIKQLTICRREGHEH